MNRYICQDFYIIKSREDFDIWMKRIDQVHVSHFMLEIIQSSNGYF